MNGVFITFEGIDGSGKTTQMELAAQRLQELGHAVLCTREPGGTPVGDRIRSVLLDPECSELCDRSELLLYAAARAQHVQQLILPALARQQIVLCDRFSDSTVVYQGCGRNIDAGQLQQLNDFAAGGLIPDLTLLFDIPLSVMKQRVTSRGCSNRMDRQQEDFYMRVREGYLNLCRDDTTRMRCIDATRDKSDIHRDVMNIVEELLARGNHHAHAGQ